MPLPARAEEGLARAVLGPSLGLRRGEVVTIESWSHALPWALALVREARRRGAEPILVVEDEETYFHSLEPAEGRTIPQAPPALVAGSDVFVYLPGPQEFPRLFGLRDRDLLAAVRRHGPNWWRAARRRPTRVARLAISSATPTAADHYGVDLDTWQRLIYRACLYPTGQLRRRCARLARELDRARQLEIRHSNGTDLRLELRHGSLRFDDGRVDARDRHHARFATRIPAGAVSVGIEPTSVAGIWESNRPTYRRFRDPPSTQGSRFTFRRGRLVEYSFARGGEAFRSALAQGGPARLRPSRISFGLNPEADGIPELEEIALGTITLWLGGEAALELPRRAAFSFASPLAGADGRLDGRSWWSDRGPRRTAHLGTRSVTRPRTGTGGRTPRGADRPARDGAARSARR